MGTVAFVAVVPMGAKLGWRCSCAMVGFGRQRVQCFGRFGRNSFGRLTYFGYVRCTWHLQHFLRLWIQAVLVVRLKVGWPSDVGTALALHVGMVLCVAFMAAFVRWCYSASGGWRAFPQSWGRMGGWSCCCRGAAVWTSAFCVWLLGAGI